MFKKKRKRNLRTEIVRTGVFVCCVAIAITVSFTLVCTSISNGGTIVAKRLSTDRSISAVDGTDLILSGFIERVDMLAAAISSEKELTLADAIRLENTVLVGTELSHLGVLFTDGRNFSACGVKLNQEAKDAIAPAFLGKSFITTLYCEQADQQHTLDEHPLIACAPIRRNNVIVGAIFVKISNERLINRFKGTSARDGVMSHIIDSDLHNIFEPESTVAFDAFSHLEPELQKQYKAAMKSNKLGRVTFDYDKQLVVIAQTPHDGFYVMTKLSYNRIFSEIMRAIDAVLMFILALMIIFSVVLFIIARHNKLSNRRAKNASAELDTLMSNIQGGVVRFELDDKLHIKYLNQGLLFVTGYDYHDLKNRLNNSFLEFINPQDKERCLEYIKTQAKAGLSIELDCRIKCKKGDDLWFLVRGNLLHQNNSMSYLCILSDITTMKQSEHELNMTMQRYSIVIEQSDSIIFEYSYLDGSMYLSNKWCDKFDFPSDSKDFFNEAMETKFIHEEDIKKVADIVADIKGGAPFKMIDIRLMANTKNYIWCTLKASAIFDENGEVYKTVGRIIDVNKQYHETEMLKKKAELDSLTAIFNKATTQMLIDNFLELEGKDKEHALLVIDIDNFKQVNDTMGHLAGDAVIKGVATKVKALLRCGDIFGRIGGDEFVVLLKGAGDSQRVRAKAQELCEAFINSVTFEDKKVDISCSIGIAFYGKTAQTYEQLVDKADTALYIAKKNGKNQFSVYGE